MSGARVLRYVGDTVEDIKYVSVTAVFPAQSESTVPGTMRHDVHQTTVEYGFDRAKETGVASIDAIVFPESFDAIAGAERYARVVVTLDDGSVISTPVDGMVTWSIEGLFNSRTFLAWEPTC